MWYKFGRHPIPAETQSGLHVSVHVTMRTADASDQCVYHVCEPLRASCASDDTDAPVRVAVRNILTAAHSRGWELSDDVLCLPRGYTT